MGSEPARRSLKERSPSPRMASLHPSFPQHWLISPYKQPCKCTLPQKLRYDQARREMKNVETLMTKETEARVTRSRRKKSMITYTFVLWSLIRHSSFVIRHFSSLLPFCSR